MSFPRKPDAARLGDGVQLRAQLDELTLECAEPIVLRCIAPVLRREPLFRRFHADALIGDAAQLLMDFGEVLAERLAQIPELHADIAFQPSEFALRLLGTS